MTASAIPAAWAALEGWPQIRQAFRHSKQLTYKPEAQAQPLCYEGREAMAAKNAKKHKKARQRPLLVALCVFCGRSSVPFWDSSNPCNPRSLTAATFSTRH